MTRPPHVEEFLNLGESLNAARQAIGKKDLPIQHLGVLAFIIVEPGASATKLAQQVGLTADGISKILKALQQDYGFVSYVLDEKDQRIKRFYLTKQGREAAIQYLKIKRIETEPGQIPTIRMGQKPRIEGGEE